MEFWEFNLYVKGYKEVYYNEQMNLMTLAYNTGMFSRETKHKPKPLEYYTNQIEKLFHGDRDKHKPVDVKFAKEIEKEIEKLKKGDNENGQ